MTTSIISRSDIRRIFIIAIIALILSIAAIIKSSIAGVPPYDSYGDSALLGSDDVCGDLDLDVTLDDNQVGVFLETAFADQNKASGDLDTDVTLDDNYTDLFVRTVVADQSKVGADLDAEVVLDDSQTGVVVKTALLDQNKVGGGLKNKVGGDLLAEVVLDDAQASVLAALFDGTDRVEEDDQDLGTVVFADADHYGVYVEAVL